MLSRQAVLEEMQQRFEGLGEGVRRVLAAVTDGRAPSVRGILGNFLETDMQHAAVIEAALAGAEEWLVVDKLAEAVEAAPALRELLAGDGGVELICLDELSAAASAPDGPVPEGAVARASEWVRCEPFLAPAVELLLGLPYDGYLSGEWIRGFGHYDDYLPRELATLKRYEAGSS